MPQYFLDQTFHLRKTFATLWEQEIQMPVSYLILISYEIITKYEQFITSIKVLHAFAPTFLTCIFHSLSPTYTVFNSLTISVIIHRTSFYGTIKWNRRRCIVLSSHNVLMQQHRFENEFNAMWNMRSNAHLVDFGIWSLATHTGWLTKYMVVVVTSIFALNPSIITV